MKEKTKDITPKAYATWYGYSIQYVNDSIRDGKHLPCVLEVKSFGGVHMLTVSAATDLKKKRKKAK